MNEDSFEHFDAPYVLGSLPDSDRFAFEAHLAGCAACSERVAEARVARRLLAFASEASYLGPPPPTGELAWLAEPPHRQRAAHVADSVATTAVPAAKGDLPARRRVTAWSSAAVAAVAACLVAVAVVSWPGHTPDPNQPSRDARPFINEADAPFSANAEVTASQTWEEVRLWCTYRDANIPPGNYLAVVRGKSGRSTVIGSWPGLPGQTTVIRVPTGYHVGEIASIDITTPNGRTLSRLTL